MTDIAKIGFSADTRDLEKAVLTLNKLKNASQGISTNTDKMTRAVEGSGASLNKVSVQVARAKTLSAKANLEMAQTSGQATKAEIQQAQTSLKLARAEETKARALYASARAHASVEKAAVGQLSAMQRINAVTGVSGGMNLQQLAQRRQDATEGFSLARDQMPNRFNTANIAAQFQDVGVTAAMGMNPLTIALQQGTQLSAILNSMESPLKGIAIAFRSIINPVSLLSIAFIALVAAGVQLVDWTEFARSGLMFLADAIEVATPYVLGLGAALAVIYAPAILTGLWAVTKGITLIGTTALIAGGKMAAAWLLGLGPIGLIVTAIGGVIALLATFGGSTVLEPIKTAVNAIVGAFVGAFNSIVATFKQLPAVLGDLIIQGVNNVVGGVEGMVNKIIQTINEIPGVKIDLQLDGQGGVENVFAGSAAGLGEVVSEEMRKAMEADYVGALGDNIKGVADGIRGFASGLGAESEDKKSSRGKSATDEYNEIIQGAERRVASLKGEQTAIGMTEEAAAKLRYETDLLNQANQKGLELTPVQIAQLGQLAGSMASIEAETKRVNDILQFSRETSKGFFTDMFNDLRQGESVWDSFANAAMRAIDKIIEKQFEMLMANEVTTGFLDAITGGIGDMFGGRSSTSSSVKPFAKGGAFTNSVVSSPTMFAFANGGAFGVMGEAGPEAVMPLHRGSDGSLGVKMSGGGGGNVVVNVINNGNSEVTTKQTQTGNGGMNIDVMIDQAVAQNMMKPGTKTNQALNAYSSRSMVRR